MSQNGWVKLYRDLLNWEWYDAPNMVHFFIHCLLSANHESKEWRGVLVEKGQFISSIGKISTATSLSEQQVRTCIKKLQKTKELTIKTTNKYTVFELNSWNKYQLEDKSNKQGNNQTTRKITNEQQSNNNQITTNKNDKNDKNDNNEKKERKREVFSPPSLLEIQMYCADMGYDDFDSEAYFDSRQASGWEQKSGKKLKDWKADVRVWARKGWAKKGIDLSKGAFD